MPKFGKSSTERLNTLDPRLKAILNEVIKYFDFSIIEGHRPVPRQYELYRQGRKLLADGTYVKTGKTVTNIDGYKVKGKHNYTPSLAVDVAPYPIDFSNKGKARERFYFLMGMIKMEAEKQGVKIRFGLDWDGDNIYDDQSFDDLPHLEIIDD